MQDTVVLNPDFVKKLFKEEYRKRYLAPIYRWVLMAVLIAIWISMSFSDNDLIDQKAGDLGIVVFEYLHPE